MPRGFSQPARKGMGKPFFEPVYCKRNQREVTKHIASETARHERV